MNAVESLLEILFSLQTIEKSACLHGLLSNPEDADSIFV
jgi:hypothetical protein